MLALLCVVAAAGAGLLLWQRLNPSYVDSSIFAATRDGVQALYAYDYRDSEKSIEGKLAVLTGDLREQYENDLEQGGIIETYQQVSATTRYEVLDVGLQQVNDAQDTATLVVFGQYVVKSVNSGDQAAPEGSECQVTPEGAQSCTQTVEVRRAQGRRRVEDQRAHAAARPAESPASVPARNSSAWQSRGGRSAGIMGTAHLAPGSRGRCPPGVAPVATGPPTWTAPRQG